MIKIIFGPPRVGKTVLMTHLMNEIMFDRQRYRQMKAEIEHRNNMLALSLSIPNHCIYSNYKITGKHFGYSRRESFDINPYRLGYKNADVEVHFLPPYAVIGITEAQKYLNSRMFKFYPSWQSRWYEQHGHNHLDIFMDVQRPNLIDVNIRELSSFIEVQELKPFKNFTGDICQLLWIVREIPDEPSLTRYISSGKKDTGTFKEKKIIAEYNVFELYDSRSCKPKFYEGHNEEDFLLGQPHPDDELPKNFYTKGDK